MKRIKNFAHAVAPFIAAFLLITVFMIISTIAYIPAANAQGVPLDNKPTVAYPGAGAMAHSPTASPQVAQLAPKPVAVHPATSPMTYTPAARPQGVQLAKKSSGVHPGTSILLKGFYGFKTDMQTTNTVKSDDGGFSKSGRSAGMATGFQIELLGKPIPYLALGAAFGSTFVGSDADNLSPVLDCNLAIKAILPLANMGNFNVVELYAGATGGLSLGLEKDMLDNGYSPAIGWNVNPMGGVQVNFIRNVGMFVEAGWSYHQVTYNGKTYEKLLVKKTRQVLRDAKAKLDISWAEVRLTAGMAFSF